MMLAKETAVLSSDAHYFMKSIPIATLSYSNYPPSHNNQLWVSWKTDHFIIFPVQWISRGISSAPQAPGAQLGRLSAGGDSSWGQIQRKKDTPSLTPVIWDPSWGCWPEHPHTASPNSPCASLRHDDCVPETSVPRLTFHQQQCEKIGRATATEISVKLDNLNKNNHLRPLENDQR